MRASVLVALAFVIVCAFADGNAIANAAQSMVDQYPYSWGGGNDYGATYGMQMEISPYCDDTGVVGFDCSGLAKYSVYQGSGNSIYHHAQTQYDDCDNYVDINDLQPGDLVFYGYDSSSIFHVTIYVGNNEIVEAPGHYPDCSGMPMRQTALRSTNLIGQGCRYW